MEIEKDLRKWVNNSIYEFNDEFERIQVDMNFCIDVLEGIVNKLKIKKGILKEGDE